MRTEDLLELLSGVRKSGNGWEARCPAHEDNRQSLSVSEGRDGKLLAFCHAGCTLDSICEGLKISPKDLFPPEDRPGPREPIATYRYHDEDGKELYRVERYWPKDFRPYLPGAATPGMGTVRRVLYRLPELIRAVTSGKRVYVVEGEKDVDALRSRGLEATCNVGGAGKWRKDYADFLKGADVVILPDNDEAGEKHATLVAEGLAGVAKCRIVRLPGLPPKGDVSDWLEKGTAEELEALVAPRTEDSLPVPLDEFLQEAEPDYAWLLEGIMPAGCVVLIASMGGLGKSTLMVQMGLQLAAGAPDFMGFKIPCAARVLYLQTEGSRHVFKGRVNTAKHYILGKDVSLDGFFVQPRGNWAKDVGPALRGYIEATKAQIAILDTQGMFHPADENSNTEIKQHLIIPLKALALETGCAFVIIHHESKPGKDAPGGRHSIRGASAFVDDTDLTLRLEAPHGKSSKIRRLVFEKNRSGADPEPIDLEFITSEAKFVATDAQAAEREEEERTASEHKKRINALADKMYKVVKLNPRYTAKQIDELMRPARNQDILEARTLLLEQKRVFTESGEDRRQLLYYAGTD